MSSQDGPEPLRTSIPEDENAAVAAGVPRPKVLALAGGVGGAKLALGLARILEPQDLTIVVNTGDDDEFHGLYVSPDIDTVNYTLAGLANPETGWGVAGDTFHALGALGRLGAETWFGLGDRDLALHVRRTEMLKSGMTLSEVTAELGGRLGVAHRVVPMTDDPVRTIVQTGSGEMSFQEYFVHRRSEPQVRGLRFDGADSAAPAPDFIDALESASVVVLCPSNPFLSIGPILAVGDARERLATLSVPRVVVSPIIGGRAVRGPAARLFETLGNTSPSALAVARHYDGLATHFVLDDEDASQRAEVEALGYEVLVTRTLMTEDAHKIALARAICGMAGAPV